MVSHALITAAIQRLLSNRFTPVVVALDGRSGSGKSTLARFIADDLKAALIPCDDFFAADIPRATWDTLAQPLEPGMRLIGVASEPKLSSRC